VRAGRALPRRLARAALLDSELYEEVEAEPASLRQAGLVVGTVCVVGALGTWLRLVVLGGLPVATARVPIVVDLLEPLLFWTLGSAFAYMVGATFFRGPETRTDYAEVLRTTGFAFVPGLLRGLSFVPPPSLGLLLTVAGDLWMLACGIVAVRQALDFTTARALGTFGVAYVLMWLVLEGLL